ncbi:ECF-type sigma factor [Acanthopleuribacter pedis]|uniref:RNA polymerase sigma-70 ECF-like HTH domain-containing protein n=1 Tax=Acanthopleuribacter pedis TaxID=442870 RepID=A0A8J7QUK5_9BACT|nr:ECF-type sigma factor [Acanthopleuribacter pedis]MBO1323378.1 hypothetical protein [Acanthopleuribacter pedis]
MFSTSVDPAKCAVDDVTCLINHWRRHGDAALHHLWQEIGDDLKRLSISVWSDFLGPTAAQATLSATDLLHETFPKLLDYPLSRDFENRAQFYALVKSLMLYLLLNYRRKKGRRDRYRHPDEVTALAAPDMPALDLATLTTLEQGLQRLQKIAPRQAQIVTMRFFEDQSFQAIQDQLSLSRTTVYTDLKAALLFLRHHLDP